MFVNSILNKKFIEIQQQVLMWIVYITPPYVLPPEVCEISASPVL